MYTVWDITWISATAMTLAVTWLSPPLNSPFQHSQQRYHLVEQDEMVAAQNTEAGNLLAAHI